MSSRKNKVPQTPQVTEQTEPQIDLLSGQLQKGESDSAVIACNEWLRLGAGRTLPDLLERLTDTSQLSPITRSLGTLKQWSMNFGWAERAKEYDAGWEARKNAEREAMLNHALASEYGRLRRLYRLEAMLEAQIYERGLDDVLHNIWVPDVKSIGGGENAERVDIERFNSALLEQYRKVLDDIAKETGGRVQKQEVKVDDWRSQAIEDIKARKVNFFDLVSAFGDENMVRGLFVSAGVPVEDQSQ